MRRDVPQYVRDLASTLRKKQTDAEKLLWEQIRRKNLEHSRFRRQYPIGRYIADFYCRDANLVIEIDGKIHNTNERREYDKIREEEIQSTNIRIVRFTNKQILNDLNSVLIKLKTLINHKGTADASPQLWGEGR